ncbi:hypothetical protein RNJ44_04358 [Nakaseomyces bracarensis]|uniref:AN1-type domain-containing protein n=1 Tax=Nakaseomyces bracarensis TaxID=273131 RepID=A0ABR4NUX7_9SACH
MVAIAFAKRTESVVSEDSVRETGMLDVGTHCQYCRQIDFLPFHCKYCEGDFCGEHRSKESHHCKWLLEHPEEADNKSEPSTPPKSNKEKFFQSLLPEKAHVRVKSPSPSAPSNGQSAKLGSGPSNKSKETTKVRSTLNPNALNKLLSFFKRTKSDPAVKRKTSARTNKLLEISNLKKQAKGDAKIPVQNRIYIYCQVILDEDEKNDAAGLKKEPLYINKMWPVGRALDSISQQLHVTNVNGKVDVTKGEKLFLYKYDEKNNEYVGLDTSGRVTALIKDLDTVYLVRGQI